MREPAFVAEVSSNHHADLDRCLAFVDCAADVGCDAVKFQLFRVDALFAPEILAASPEHRQRSAWELPVPFLAALATRARERGLAFGCTPFDLAGVEVLEPYVDFFKVASYELLWDDLLSACAATGRPLVVSTGMATGEEVGRAVDVVRRAGGRDLTLLHCVSDYPARPETSNLAALGTLRALARARGVAARAGWSDHSVEPGVIQRAVHAHGASLIEFHLDLDGRGAEFRAGHCWLPGAAAELIRQVRAGLAADGSPRKAPTAAEHDERAWRADPSDGLRPLRSIRESWCRARA